MTFSLAKFNNREEHLDKILQYLDEEIELRIESIKISIDRYHTIMTRKVKKIQHKMLNRIEILRNFKIHSESASDFIKNIKQVRLYDNFNLISCNEEINTYLIGYIAGLNSINIYKIKTSNPKAIDLKNSHKYPTGVCCFKEEKILITDNQRNEICIFNNSITLLERVSCIDHVKFNGPRGICTNSKDSVYICDTGNDRIVIVDEKFTTVKRIVGKKGKKHGEFDWPSDICYYNESIFVLDEINHRIQQFTSNGDFEKLIDLNTTYSFVHRSHTFKKISVYDDLIAVLNKHYICIYDLNGTQLQKISKEHEKSVFFSSIYLQHSSLIANLSDGSLVCYTLVKQNENNNNSFIMAYVRFIENLKKPTCGITKFNDHLLISCMCDNLLVLI